jgi:diketogulonate reductase-like aldo/keto reductase
LPSPVPSGDDRVLIQRRLGKTNVLLPVIGQGTWELERERRSQVIAAIRAGLDAGMTHIDTAEMYGDGEVEELVGEAIAGRRDEVFVVSKVLPENASYEGTLAACERSLERLRSDRLDLYLLHWRGEHPLEETFRAFERLREEGKLRFWGVSNFDVDDLEEALTIAGEGVIACNQVLYHLKERTIEHAVLPWCERHGIAVVAYSPFGSGDFPGPRSEGGRVLADIAHAHGVSPRQVALRFLVSRELMFAIPRSADPAHVRANAAAADLVLSAEETTAIERAFPRGRKQRLPMI